jgi:hypothetical protein
LLKLGASRGSDPSSLAKFSAQRPKNKDVHRLYLEPIALDDFRHGNAEPGLVDKDHFAPGDEPIVDINVDRLTQLAIEFDDSAAAQLEQLANLHGAFAQNRADGHWDVINGLEVTGTTTNFAGGRFGKIS